MWSNPPITNTAVPSLPRRERRINTDITNTPEVENLLNHLKLQLQQPQPDLQQISRNLLLLSLGPERQPGSFACN
ncbi:hypothetical protein PRIPAC_85509 [Pristionchus pacificus]|uniref:Uncharacterized protein n=1 Tax=Pristionchus pacificus TaxID=54126 RepID=A0A2A6BT73_PRIPA|nr:hypothetical protein PRIPAC_85509 [Pristionchus pacificus]|eukprot:PDM69100.1 hypothetical protein PRIPAC_47402 [Pristionchus pacificus]